jgi:hypothetical protein
MIEHGKLAPEVTRRGVERSRDKSDGLIMVEQHFLQ